MDKLGKLEEKESLVIEIEETKLLLILVQRSHGKLYYKYLQNYAAYLVAFLLSII